jgi:hypothetical protein
MVMFMRGNGLMIKWMVKEHIYIRMGPNMKETGMKISKMAMA